MFEKIFPYPKSLSLFRIGCAFAFPFLFGGVGKKCLYTIVLGLVMFRNGDRRGWVLGYYRNVLG